jgi:hypothetical protein
MTVPRPRRLARTLARAGALGLGLVLLAASPASADPAGPSDFRSEVTEIVPDAAGVDATILGGDSFLEVAVAAGHEVIVEGYSGEPYLRFRADGTVEQNRLSSATYLNDDRKGGGDIPAEVTAALQDEGTEPEWEEVASGGSYAWHDHRVHWMADASPPVGRGERVGGNYDPWLVPLTVDGQPVEVRGTLTYVKAVSPLPWAALAVVLLGGVAWFGRGRGLRLPAAALAVASLLAVVVGRADWASTPDGMGNVLLWLLPAVALVAAVAAVALAAKPAGVVTLLASVASLSGWALLRFSVLLKPVLPADVPAALDRASVAAALGLAVAAAYLAVTSGVLALPDLDDD